MFIVAKDMFGTPLAGTDGRVGALHDILFDDRSWKVRHLVVSTDRWFHGRQVLLDPEAIERADWPGRELRVRLSNEQVRQSPSVDSDLPAARCEPAEPAQVLVSEAYWAGALAGGAPFQGDPHLRSARLLAGLHIHCPDGQLGHAEDFIVDDEVWTVPLPGGRHAQLVAGQAGAGRTDRRRVDPLARARDPPDPVARADRASPLLRGRRALRGVGGGNRVIAIVCRLHAGTVPIFVSAKMGLFPWVLANLLTDF